VNATIWTVVGKTSLVWTVATIMDATNGAIVGKGQIGGGNGKNGNGGGVGK